MNPDVPFPRYVFLRLSFIFPCYVAPISFEVREGYRMGTLEQFCGRPVSRNITPIYLAPMEHLSRYNDLCSISLLFLAILFFPSICSRIVIVARFSKLVQCQFVAVCLRYGSKKAQETAAALTPSLHPF